MLQSFASRLAYLKNAKYLFFSYFKQIMGFAIISEQSVPSSMSFAFAWHLLKACFGFNIFIIYRSSPFHSGLVVISVRWLYYVIADFSILSACSEARQATPILLNIVPR